MLYDERWDKQITADPFLLESLIAWLETRDTAESYDYCDPRDCMLCRYFGDHGWKEPLVDFWGVEEKDGDDVPYPRVFWEIANVPDPAGWTMGAALERARKALAAIPVTETM